MPKGYAMLADELTGSPCLRYFNHEDLTMGHWSSERGRWFTVKLTQDPALFHLNPMDFRPATPEEVAQHPPYPEATP